MRDTLVGRIVYVERHGRSEVWVANDKEVSGLANGRPDLNDSLIERIIYFAVRAV